MRRQPKGRQAKARAREKRFYDLTARAASAPKADVRIDLGQGAEAAQRLGNEVLRLNDVTVRWQDRALFDSFTYTFTPGERIGIVGRNGAGEWALWVAACGLPFMARGFQPPCRAWRCNRR